MKKVVLVTGGSSGIGASICERLANEGHIVYGTSRNAIGEKIKGYTLVKLDVENIYTIQATVNEIIVKEGKIDVLINNAGVGIMGAVEDCNDEEIMKAFNINVFGLVRASRAVLPQMRKQKSGLIINIASIAGHMGLPYRGFYSATKASVQRITEALRIEVAAFGIKACVVDPGDFNTNISSNRVVSKNVKSRSVYSAETLRIEEMINSEINKSLDAEMVGELVSKIIKTSNPKVYYRVGKFMQKFSVKVRSILGPNIFENIIKKHYHIK
jgi:short-subunit dehydrogenase